MKNNILEEGRRPMGTPFFCIYKTPRLSWGSVKLTAMSRQNDSLRI